MTINLKKLSQDRKFARGQVTMDSIYDTELDNCQGYGDKLFKAIINFETLTTVQSSPRSDNSKDSGLKLRRPNAPLPTYSDNKSSISLTKFFAELESVLSKYEYSPFEMYIILKDQVTAQRAVSLLNSFKIKNHDYTSAIQALANPNL